MHYRLMQALLAIPATALLAQANKKGAPGKIVLAGVNLSGVLSLS